MCVWCCERRINDQLQCTRTKNGVINGNIHLIIEYDKKIIAICVSDRTYDICMRKWKLIEKKRERNYFFFRSPPFISAYNSQFSVLPMSIIKYDCCWSLWKRQSEEVDFNIGFPNILHIPCINAMKAKYSTQFYWNSLYPFCLSPLPVFRL